MTDKREREVASSRVADDDDILGRKAGVVDEIAIACERVQHCSREGVRGRIGRGGGQAVINGKRALNGVHVLKQSAREVRGGVRGISGTYLSKSCSYDCETNGTVVLT